MGPGTSGGKGEAGQGLVDGWGMGFWLCDIGDDAAHRVRVQGAPGRCAGEVSEEVDESIRLSGPGAFEMCIECMVVAYLPGSTLPSDRFEFKLYYVSDGICACISDSIRTGTFKWWVTRWLGTVEHTLTHDSAPPLILLDSGTQLSENLRHIIIPHVCIFGCIRAWTRACSM